MYGEIEEMSLNSQLGKEREREGKRRRESAGVWSEDALGSGRQVTMGEWRVQR